MKYTYTDIGLPLARSQLKENLEPSPVRLGSANELRLGKLYYIRNYQGRSGGAFYESILQTVLLIYGRR